MIDYLTIAETSLSTAKDALRDEVVLTVGDADALWDALSLTADALSQVRGVKASRLPERPIIDRRAS